MREQENEQCVGGMRGPAESVRKIPGWAKVGDLLRPSLCEAVEESKDLQWAFEEYTAEMDGKQWAERFGPVLAEVGAKVAGKMADALGASGLENVVGPTGWRRGLLGKMVEVAGDPEVDVPNWLGGETPLGVSKEVPGRGIFPKAGPTEAQLASYEFLAGRTAWDVDSNYTSYVEHSEESRKELLRLVEEGHLEKIALGGPALSAQRLPRSSRPSQTVPSRCGSWWICEGRALMARHTATSESSSPGP